MNKKAYTYDYPRPAVTADSVVFCNDSDGLSILLIERASEPFKGCWAFPGGFMDMDEKAEVKGSDDAAQARWFPIDSIPSLAFDHEKILAMALEKIKKGKV